MPSVALAEAFRPGMSCADLAIAVLNQKALEAGQGSEGSDQNTTKENRSE